MRYPSVKTLATLTGGDTARARILRAVLDGSYTIPKYDNVTLESHRERFPQTVAWVTSCYNWPLAHSIKMCMADEILGTYGVEYIPHGRNAKSPAIEYCNTGDMYTCTLMFVNGAYRVGCWGDIEERGSYE